jgi:hypothetical protein
MPGGQKPECSPSSQLCTPLLSRVSARRGSKLLEGFGRREGQEEMAKGQWPTKSQGPMTNGLSGFGFRIWDLVLCWPLVIGHCHVTRSASSMSRFATHGMCTARQAVMADPMERQGVRRSMHHARRKKLSRRGASAAGKTKGSKERMKGLRKGTEASGAADRLRHGGTEEPRLLRSDAPYRLQQLHEAQRAGGSDRTAGKGFRRCVQHATDFKVWHLLHRRARFSAFSFRVSAKRSTFEITLTPALPEYRERGRRCARG